MTRIWNPIHSGSSAADPPPHKKQPANAVHHGGSATLDPPLYLNKCQVKCIVFGSQDAVSTLKRQACDVDLRLAVIVFALENEWYPKRTRWSFSLHHDYKGWY